MQSAAKMLHPAPAAYLMESSLDFNQDESFKKGLHTLESAFFGNDDR
jgi:hypothetical protein